MDAGARGADSLRLHDPMRQKLVHAQRGGQHPAPDDGDAGELEHSLYGSILAVGAVQDGNTASTGRSCRPLSGRRSRADALRLGENSTGVQEEASIHVSL